MNLASLIVAVVAVIVALAAILLIPAERERVFKLDVLVGLADRLDETNDQHQDAMFNLPRIVVTRWSVIVGETEMPMWKMVYDAKRGAAQWDWDADVKPELLRRGQNPESATNNTTLKWEIYYALRKDLADAIAKRTQSYGQSVSARARARGAKVWASVRHVILRRSR